MKTYGELNLKYIRDMAGLDFAHYSYQKGQCSCCYGPLDMSDKYWAKGRKPKKVDYQKLENGGATWHWDRDPKDVQYILFKNASNNTGWVTKNDTICLNPKHHKLMYAYRNKYEVMIEWSFPEEKMDMVLKMLKEQLDDDYVVLRPADKRYCIRIVLKSELREEEEKYVF